MTLISITVGALGDIGVEELKSGNPHRRVVLCGSIVGGEWVDTDVSEDLPEVQAVASTAWTTEVVAAYRAIVEANYVPPPPDPDPVTHLNNGGLARFSGASPIVVYEAIRMAGVTRISKGRYRVTHEVPMPTDQYSAFPSVFDALPRVIRITARTANYVELRVTDLAGVVQDPTEAAVQTERVVTT